jgi:hypothetical protein
VRTFDWWRLLAISAVGAASLMVPASAGAFGTINGMGQHAEHEKITKVLSCGAEDSVTPCFESASMAMLAGSDGTVGGVGLPDRVTEIIGHGSAHCDDADYLPGRPYQRSDAARAVKAINDCVDLFGRHMEEAVNAAGGLANGREIIYSQADATDACPWDLSGSAGVEIGSASAKCKVVDGLGRALHAAEDFWSHTNWGDRANPDEPTIVGEGANVKEDEKSDGSQASGPAKVYNVSNPPGLERTEVVPFLRYPIPRDQLPTEAEMLAGTAPISGCDDSADEIANKGWKIVNKIYDTGLKDSCPNRVKHSALNKDKGLIDWKTGKTSDPGTPRGQVGDNFQRAVTGARKQVRAIWGDFVTAIDSRYGSTRGALILRAFTVDTPWTTCQLSGKSPFVKDLPGGAHSSFRSVTALVRNETGQSLSCGEAVLDSGVWGSLPADTIAPRSTASFRTESNLASVNIGRVKVASGGPEGSATYVIGTTGYGVRVSWDNPLFGSNGYGCEVLRSNAPDKNAPYRCTRSGGSGNDSKPIFSVTGR